MNRSIIRPPPHAVQAEPGDSHFPAGGDRGIFPRMDLFEYAASRPVAAPPPQPPAWEDAGTTLWGRVWLANVRRLCLPRFDSALTFGENVLRAGRLRSCRVRGTHAQATFANREGGTVLVNLRLQPLADEQWRRIERLCGRCGDTLLSSEDVPDDVASDLFSPPDGLLPEGREIASSCSHCTRPFCLYRAAALFAVASELDRSPIKLFELRGASRTFMLTHAAQQTWEEDEPFTRDELMSIFGVELTA